MGISCKLFLGIKEDSEIRMHLGKSNLWQEDKVSGLAELKERDFDKSVYIGCYIAAYLTVFEIKDKEKFIKQQLQQYCPKVNWDRHQSIIFSEVFIL